jgi:F-type H+-transporting ATPase subunit delta
MRGASERAARAVVERVEEEVGSGSPGAAEGGSLLQRVGRLLPSSHADVSQLGDELFTLSRILDAQPSLRRVLTDPTVEADRKAELAQSLLSDFDDATVRVVADAVRRRWSRARDLADALELGGISALLAAAQDEGDLDDLEDGLFRFARIVEGDPALRDALNDRGAPVEARQRLVEALLADRVSAPTLRLARQAVTGRHRSVVSALAEMQRLAAARRERLVAVVRVARPLSDELRDRLVAALTTRFGQQLQVNVIVDPDVLGGVRVTIGDQVVDGTVSTKLAEARRRLAG